MNQRLLDKIRDCADLPSLPAVALRVMDLTQKPDITPQQVADAISMDPALVAKVLRTVNSPFYGCSQAIGSMHGAVVMLGMQSVKTLVLSFSIVSALPPPAVITPSSWPLILSMSSSLPFGLTMNMIS